MNNSVPGSCQCGAVRFEAPLPSLWCAHCHCADCRKAHGAGYVTWAGFKESTVRFAGAESPLHWRHSSETAERGFCRACGSTMFYRSTRWPGELHIAVGVLDGAIDKAPQVNVYVDEAVDWVALDDALSGRGPNA